MSRIAFIGLGNMGLGMATRLIEAGHDLRVYNRTATRAEALIRRGASRFDSPKTACQDAQAIISMVADDDASRAIWLGADGIFAADLNGCFAIECSTLSHGWVMELAGRCEARGMRYIDAPVTGLPDSAAAGALTFLVGASTVDLSAVQEVLAVLSTRIIRFGDIGTGTAYKLIINLVGAVQIASAAEAMAIAERAGLDLGTVVDAIGAGQAASPQVVRNTQRMLAADHDREIAFTSALRLKDIDYALRFARELGIGAPFGAIAERMYRELCRLGFAQINESKIIDVSRNQTAQGRPS